MRACLIILDSCGVGELPDAEEYGDIGSNSVVNVAKIMGGLNLPNMQKLGFGNIIDILGVPPVESPSLSYGKMACMSAGKDSTIGHWEHFGIITKQPFPTYPDGFPDDIISEFEQKTGRKTIGNKPMSGTEIIMELGEEHIQSGDLIVYTSADSVFQVAAHEDIVPVEELYQYCLIARNILTGERSVSRVIARPFIGEPGNFERTANRHDFSIKPTEKTGLNILSDNGFDVISIGKINDLFAGSGITRSHATISNEDGIDTLIDILDDDYNGLIYINLIDFDMLWGHRNDYKGFAKGLEYFDSRLNSIIDKLEDGDLFAITADHGCDPTTPSTDHSREYVPILAGNYPFVKPGIDLGTRNTFADIGATILDYHGLRQRSGKSFMKRIK
jgi:phosphopentomutase